jgi:hypothetical protein
MEADDSVESGPAALLSGMLRSCTGIRDDFSASPFRPGPRPGLRLLHKTALDAMIAVQEPRIEFG